MIIGVPGLAKADITHEIGGESCLKVHIRSNALTQRFRFRIFMTSPRIIVPLLNKMEK